MVKLFLMLLTIMAFKAQAYIPSAKMILERVAENSLKSPLFVEQEVTLVTPDQTVSVKEQWLFENENSIRLIVRGDKDLKDQIIFQNLYSDNQRTSSLSGYLQTQKVNRSLFEKAFFTKSSENLMRFLVQNGIVTDEIFRSQNFKRLPGNTGFQYQPEPFLRLGRIGGGISYVFGPSPKGDNVGPGFWVEQDQFNILKIRSATGEEMRAEKPTTFSRGARWPRELSFAWNTAQTSAQAQAQVQVTNVRLADAAQKQVFQKHLDKRTPEFERFTGRYLLEEFYLRFR